MRCVGRSIRGVAPTAILARRVLRVVAMAIGILLLAGPPAAPAQTMPGQVYYDLLEQGHRRLARDLGRRLDLRSRPDESDVEDFIERWEREGEGPRTGYDWLAVARMWIRSGDAERARSALQRTEGRIAEALFRLESARVAFLEGDVAGASDYWKACESADEAAAIEMWLDVETLATPSEFERWDRFRTLPSGDRDACGFLRRFWNYRAAASGMDVNERVLQHYGRMQYALEHYRRRGKVKPRFSTRLGRPTNSIFDDRGLLYVRMGEPDAVAAHLAGECIEPNASWGYDRPEGYRVYHLSPMQGADDWFLLENLALVYRCGSWDHSPQAAVPPLLIDVPGSVIRDLYVTRMALDPAYAAIANQAVMVSGQAFVGSRMIQNLSDERKWTWADVEYAVATVPERPSVDPGVNFAIEWLHFRAPRPGMTRMWMNGLVEAGTLRPDGQELADVYRVEAIWTILGEDGAFLQRVPAVFEVSAPPDLGGNAGLSIRMPADVPPGEYRWMLVVKDRNTVASDSGRKPTGGYATGDLTVRDMSGDLPLLSDVAVSPDSTGMWSPGRGISMNPTPAHVTGPDGVAFIYYEAYNLTPGGRYETRVVLEPAGGGQTFDLSYPGSAPTGGRIATSGYLRLNLSDSEPGRYEMSVTVRDLTSGVSTLPIRTEILVTGN